MAVEPGGGDFDSEELLALARLALERKDVEGALSKLKKILGAGSLSAEAISLGARIYAQMGLFGRAEKFYEQFLAKNPRAVAERFLLGMTRLDAGRPGDALEVWSALLKEHPGYPPAMFYKSLALAQTGKTGEARTGLDLLLKSIPAGNPYFGHAKELLQAIESGAAAVQAAGTSGATPAAPPADRYRATR